MPFFKKLEKYQKYIDNEPAIPEQFRNGEIIETNLKYNNIQDCQDNKPVIERIEKVVNGTYNKENVICKEDGSYLKQYLAYSDDNGETWTVTDEVVNEIKIMDNKWCEFCNDIRPIRYFHSKDVYSCYEDDLHYVYKKQIKEEDSWITVEPEETYDIHKSPIYEYDSRLCNPPSYLTEKQEQQVLLNPEETYECVDPNTETATKWSVYRVDETENNGETWNEGTDLIKYREYEINSSDCGWIDSFEVVEFDLDYKINKINKEYMIIRTAALATYDPEGNLIPSNILTWDLPFIPVYGYNLDTNQVSTIKKVVYSDYGNKIGGYSITTNNTGIYRVHFIGVIQKNVINDKIKGLGYYWLHNTPIYRIDIDLREVVGEKIELDFYGNDYAYNVNGTGYLCYCKELTYINENFFQIFASKATSLYNMFNNSLNYDTKLPSSLFSNFNNVVDLNLMFYGSYIDSLPQGIFDDFINVESMELTFASSLIREIPYDLFYTLSKLSDIGGLFYETPFMTTLPKYCFKNNKNITNTIASTAGHEDAFNYSNYYHVVNDVLVMDQLYNINCNNPIDIGTDGLEYPFCHRIKRTPGYTSVRINGCYDCG